MYVEHMKEDEQRGWQTTRSCPSGHKYWYQQEGKQVHFSNTLLKMCNIGSSENWFQTLIRMYKRCKRPDGVKKLQTTKILSNMNPHKKRNF